jgi:hypothetical protein
MRRWVRPFVGRHPTCPRRIGTERVPARVAPEARQTQRRLAALQVIGVALGGQAGARRAHHRGLPVRRGRRLPLPVIPPLQASGGEDWAPRKRQRSGTMVVDRARPRPVA